MSILKKKGDIPLGERFGRFDDQAAAKKRLARRRERLQRLLPRIIGGALILLVTASTWSILSMLWADSDRLIIGEQTNVAIAATAVSPLVEGYLANAVSGTPDTKLDFYRAVHHGVVKKIEVDGKFTEVTFVNQPKNHPAPYRCTRGLGGRHEGVHVQTSPDGVTRCVIKKWHSGSWTEWNWYEMRIEVPADQVKAVRAAVKSGKGSFSY